MLSRISDGFRLVDIVPALLQLLLVDGLKRQELRHHALLRHGVDEHVVHQQELVDLRLAVVVEHDLGRADQRVDVRLVAQMGGRGGNLDAGKPPEELQRLRTDGADVDLGILCPRFADRAEAALNKFRLSEPHNPRSVLMTTMPTARTGRSRVYGCL